MDTLATLPPTRLEAMQPSAIRDVHDLGVRLRAQNPERHFIALHFGEPDLGTPEFIVEAGCDALRNGAVFYENNHGRADLRAALGEHFGLTPERFLVSSGAVQAICLTMLSVVRPGDDVIVVTPLWPNFTEAARMAGANIHEVPLRFNDNERCFELDEKAIEATAASVDRLRMIIVNSPSNPTGWTITPVQQQKLLALSQQEDIYLVADEIYGRILAPNTTFESWNQYLSSFDKLLIINGFSKAYCMTGWRVGYVIGEPGLINEMGRMQEFVTSCAASAAQVACITALRDGEAFVASCSERYQQLRELVSSRLAKLPGSTVARTDGTFYIFFKLPGSEDSVQFCRELLTQTGVSLAPGKAFGAGGEGWLRMCFAKEPARLEEAIALIGDFLGTR